MLQNWFRRLCVALTVLAAGCGGGEGGGPVLIPLPAPRETSNNPPPTVDPGPFRLTASPSSLYFEYFEGQLPPRYVTLVAGSAGVPSPPRVYFRFGIEGNALREADPYGPVLRWPTYFYVEPRGGLSVGTYTGNVLVYGCEDENCTRPVNGSPLRVPYRVEVKRVLATNPASLNLSAVGGTTVTQRVTVTPTAGATSFAIGSDFVPPYWMSIEDVTSTGFTVRGRTVRSGVYETYVPLDSGGVRSFLPIRYQVSVPPTGESGPQAQPSSLTFVLLPGAISEPQDLIVTPPTWGEPVSIRVDGPYGSPAPTWLTVLPAPNGYKVSTSAVGLGEGVYTAWILLLSDGGTRNVTVPVALTVGRAMVTPADESVQLSATTVPGDLIRQVPINAINGSFNWTATSDSRLVVLTRAAGVSGTTLEYRVDPSVHLQSWTPPARITVWAEELKRSVTFQVAVSGTLPRIDGAWPPVAVSGSDVPVLLYGSGFGQLDGDLTTWLTSGDVPVTGARRLSDREMEVFFGTPASGSVQLGIKNRLGLSTSLVPVQVVAPRTLPYASFPSPGRPRSSFVDPLRGDYYVVSHTDEVTGRADQLHRFRRDGVNWASAVVATDVADAGLNPNARSLVIAKRTGEVQVVGLPDAWIIGRTPWWAPSFYTLDAASRLSNRRGIAMTYNFGGFPAAWLAGSSPSRERAVVKLLMSIELEAAYSMASPVADPFGLYEGPVFYASRNGTFMLMRASLGKGDNDTYSFDPRNDQWLNLSPLVPPNLEDASLSDDGQRFLFNRQHIFRRDRTLVGALHLPPDDVAQWGVVAGQLSPDGKTAWLMAYPKAAGADDVSASNLKPRIYRFAIPADPPSQTIFAEGYFEVDHYASTCNWTDPSSCTANVKSAISADGMTLYFAGDARVLVVPVQPLMTPPTLVRPMYLRAKPTKQ